MAKYDIKRLTYRCDDCDSEIESSGELPLYASFVWHGLNDILSHVLIIFVAYVVFCFKMLFFVL
jgi:hypothetical protein